MRSLDLSWPLFWPMGFIWPQMNSLIPVGITFTRAIWPQMTPPLGLHNRVNFGTSLSNYYGKVGISKVTFTTWNLSSAVVPKFIALVPSKIHFYYKILFFLWNSANFGTFNVNFGFFWIILNLRAIPKFKFLSFSSKITKNAKISPFLLFLAIFQNYQKKFQLLKVTLRGKHNRKEKCKNIYTCTMFTPDMAQFWLNAWHVLLHIL